MVLFLAGGRGFTRREGLRRIKERLEKEPGFTTVQYRPSRLRPRSVVADVDTEMFLGEEFPRKQATFEIAWRPRAGTDVQRVQWADDAVSLGWHKDDDHEDLGTTHFQIETDEELSHEPGHLEAEAPLSFLETCLQRLPAKLEETITD
ncbi:hypothetical protein [Natronosalvus amylolyticus]|uniref:hypothetical protein n=1 Tax=Natronosalvus amylolyticus TaxID=2961994 RepID=UPI0020C989FD|nr:hypothetical protein [Natronosalvus amylolyticus]